MPLIPLHCPLCGASLSIDSSKDATICESCGKPFIVKDAIINSYVGGAPAAPAPSAEKPAKAEKGDEVPTIKTNIDVEEKSRWEQTGSYEPNTRNRVIYHKHKDFVVDEDTLEKYAGDELIVEIPENVKSIGYCAFSGNDNVTEIIVPETVTKIGYCAFSSCTSLKKVTIKGRVTSIAERAFLNCTALTEIKIPDSDNSMG